MARLSFDFFFMSESAASVGGGFVMFVQRVCVCVCCFVGKLPPLGNIAMAANVKKRRAVQQRSLHHPRCCFCCVLFSMSLFLFSYSAAAGVFSLLQQYLVMLLATGTVVRHQNLMIGDDEPYCIPVLNPRRHGQSLKSS